MRVLISLSEKGGLYEIFFFVLCSSVEFYRFYA